MSDDPRYAEGLQRVFAYENTFFDTEPRFDIQKPGPARLGKYDLVIPSDVFEHVSGRLETAFANLARLLKPGGA